MLVSGTARKAVRECVPSVFLTGHPSLTLSQAPVVHPISPHFARQMLSAGAVVVNASVCGTEEAARFSGANRRRLTKHFYQSGGPAGNDVEMAVPAVLQDDLVSRVCRCGTVTLCAHHLIPCVLVDRWTGRTVGRLWRSLHTSARGT